jgi:hypothetical protein
VLDNLEETALIYNVYILTKDGLSIFHRKYGGLEYDDALVTGFLSAISSFGRDISGEEIDEIVLEDKQFISTYSENLIFVAYSDKGDKVKKILSKIKEQFIKNYGDIKGEDRKTSVFDDFSPILDEIVGNSGEPGHLHFPEIRKLFDIFKSKTSSKQTM